MKLKKIFIIIILTLSFTGGYGFGPQKISDDKNAWQTQFKKYAEIYSHIKKSYPNTFNEEKLFFASINGLLKQLDPHSYFLDPLMVRSLNEDQQGNYYGIGTRIAKYEDRLTVVAPLTGTPAAVLGIMAGDVIAEIEGKETKTMSIEEAMKTLRGAKGSFVQIKIKREGITNLISYKIERAEIPLDSVSYTVVLPQAPEIGYISVRTFGNTTAKEVEDSIKRLKKENNIKALVLDLRGNAGGSLYAAIDLADFFLPKGKVIVEVKGRTLNRSFSAQFDNQYETLPLAVIINRGSASASEIVAAALQDHHRATIIGSRSWGKGLVQTINRLSMNCSLALTTAKYYTPNNKCLQRDFGQLDDYYFFINNSHYDTDKTIVGGVIPDIPITTEFYPELLVKFISRGTFFAFARQLIEKEGAINKIFKTDDGVIKKFINFLNAQKFDYDKKELEKYTPRIRVEIQREVISAKFSPEEGIKIYLLSDQAAINSVKVLKMKYKQ